MSKVTNFKQYVQSHPDWMKEHNVHRTAGGLFGVNYGRIIISVDQDFTDKDNITKKVTHTYAAAINLTNGDIYYDCEKEKITFKNGCMGLYRIVRMPLKMIYHMSIILPVANEIFTWHSRSKEEKTWGYLFFCTVRCTVLNAADILLTPIYSVALITLHLVGYVLGKCDSDLIFKQREWVYSLELLSTWGDSEALIGNDNMILADCFGPHGGNIANKSSEDTTLLLKKKKKLESLLAAYKNDLKIYNQTKALTQPVEPTMETLKHFQTDMLKGFAIRQLKYRQNYRNLMNDNYECLPKDKPYVSLAMKELTPAAAAKLNKTKPTASTIETSNTSPIMKTN